MMRPMQRLVMACVLLVGWCALAVAGPKDKRLDVYWVDVEGGAATLIITPAGESILIDSGFPARRDADRIFRTLTEIVGLRRIDHFILTHNHVDHFGGASLLAGMVPIGTVHDNGEFAGGRERPSKEYLEFKCDRRVVINPGDKFELKQADGGANVSLVCIGARQKFIDPPADAPKNEAACAAHRPKDRDGSDNANSVVMLLSCGDFRLFDAGDLTWNTEKSVVCPVNLVGKVDVYQVTHHGSAMSNNPIVLSSLTPTVAIMNNGPRKGGEPETFATLKGAKSLSAIYQGHKSLRPEGNTNNVAEEYIANIEEKCKGNTIKLSVAPDGKKYTVSIPANKHERTFDTTGK